MSLYHEAATALTAPASDGGNLKTRIFGPRSKDAKDVQTAKGKEAKETGRRGTSVIPPAQIYALAAESCKWSAVLSEVIDRAGLLEHERRARLTPVLALLLVHDLLVAKNGNGNIQLPAHHGLRAAVERHKTRLSAELTRARLRRGAPSLHVLREQVERAAAASVSTTSSLAAATRWVRVNTLKTTLEQQLATTFAGYEQVATLQDLFAADADGPRLYIDEHVPNLVAVPLVAVPASSSSSSSSSAVQTDLTRCDAYKRGAIIFQDKASCFPAYLLDPASVPGGGHVIDACAAPGNKTSHLAALLGEAKAPIGRRVFAFEKDKYRSKTLQNMLQKAGALAAESGDGAEVGISIATVNAGQDFLKVDPTAERFRDVRALLLDPSCSGSGIVGRDAMPELHLPKAAKVIGGTSQQGMPTGSGKNKRKRGAEAETKKVNEENMGDDVPADATTALDDLQSKDNPKARLAALASFQLAILLHACSFPSAQRVTYSTCSVHAEENEQVVVRALRALRRAEAGRWRLLRRDEQVAGMQAWPVRGDPKGAENVARTEDDDDDQDEDAAALAEACIRSYANDDRGVMGFFVAAFVRDEAGAEGTKAESRAQDTEQPPQTNGEPTKKKSKKAKKKAKKATGTVAHRPVEAKQDQSDDDDWGGFDD
ncbi:methyltransferase [Sporothrix brasiliensis 5110]|uniref:Methyltransferase n=1 Tax=Sporothrix brasiliensis 5110 TaxID=1398154 RepID=A0A0C2IR78_9PEZI|nr:methyltransferase [Sporothrix brasiliensis 5110]KIH89395.1 methyltransferase [Sporothrix brasiliensis 5110]